MWYTYSKKMFWNTNLTGHTVFNLANREETNFIRKAFSVSNILACYPLTIKLATWMPTKKFLRMNWKRLEADYVVIVFQIVKVTLRLLILYSFLVAKSHSLWPQGLQDWRFFFPSLCPGICSNSCPLRWWWDTTISSSITPFSSCLQSFQLFASGRQSIEASALASVLPMNIQGWFPLVLTGWISLLSRGFSRVFSNIIVPKASIFWHSPFFVVNTYIHTGLLEKPWLSLDRYLLPK